AARGATAVPGQPHGEGPPRRQAQHEHRLAPAGESGEFVAQAAVPVRPPGSVALLPAGAVSRQAGAAHGETGLGQVFAPRPHGRRCAGESVAQEHSHLGRTVVDEGFSAGEHRHARSTSRRAASPYVRMTRRRGEVAVWNHSTRERETRSEWGVTSLATRVLQSRELLCVEAAASYPDPPAGVHSAEERTEGSAVLADE